MKWFNKPKTFFRDYVFNRLFDHYYKAKDTYQDSEGKGILERFIEVCSGYLDNEIIPDIDNFIYCLDVDKSNPIFLNYLWEYFGFIPYSYGVITKGEPYTEENLERWIKEDRGFPTADCRAILKYAISLYKIRGTKKFYEILGKFYGISIDLTEADEDTKRELLGDIRDGSVKYDIYSHFDENYSTFDTETDCWECVPMILTLGIPKGKWDYMLAQDQKIQDDLLEVWKRENPTATEEEIESQKELIIEDHPSDYTDRSKKALIDIINKYLPVNVRYFETDSIVTIFQETTTILIIG